MSRRLLIVEPDPSGRAMLARVLRAAGYAAEEVESVRHARLLLDDEAFDLALVDELAGAGAMLDEARFLRTRYPRVPLVVTGTMLGAPELLELLRLGVEDALPKPFSPGDVRAAVARALDRVAPHRIESLEYAAAIAVARRELSQGRPRLAAPALSRAWACTPLDADVASLESLRAELEGRDADAARGYRAVLALRDDEGADGADPHDGLARLAAYGPARRVATLSPRFAGAPLTRVMDPVAELPALLAQPAGPRIIVMGIALTSEARLATLYLREHGALAFALATTDLGLERAAPLLARLEHHAERAEHSP